MFGRHEAAAKQETDVLAIHQDSDPEMRDEVDPDPLIEEMVERLRSGLGSLVAFDEWGRPVAWRQVVRIAAGPTLAALRDAQTAVALGQASAEPREWVAAADPADTPEPDATTSLEPSAAPEPVALEPVVPESVAPEPVALEPTAIAEPNPEPDAEPDVERPAPADQALPTPSWTYHPTATGWVAAPTTFGLRQIELDAQREAGYAAPAERSEV